MKWENLDLHMEIFLPGIVTLVLLLSLLPPDAAAGFMSPLVQKVLENEFAAGALFVASSYMAGILNHIITRIVLDRASEAAPRPWLIKRLSRGQMKGKSNEQINLDYRSRIAQTLSSANDEIKKEVQKRRQMGRLVRSTLIPFGLLVMVGTPGQGVVVTLGLVVLVFGLILLAYAYVEFTIYEECRLHLRDVTQPDDSQTPAREPLASDQGARKIEDLAPVALDPR